MCEGLESCLDDLIAVANEIEKDSNFLQAAYDCSERDKDILEADLANLIRSKANEVADLTKDAFEVSQQARREIAVSEIIDVLRSLQEANAQRLGVLLDKSSFVPNSLQPQESRRARHDLRSRFVDGGQGMRDESQNSGQLSPSLTVKSTEYPDLDGTSFAGLPKVETPPSRFHVPNLEDCGLSDETLALLAQNNARSFEKYSAIEDTVL